MRMNQTEKTVMKFYRSINIESFMELSINNIIERLNINLFFWDENSSIVFYKDKYVVFINNKISKQKQWQEFGHEMYHYLYDETTYNKLKETYATYGESKADYFAYHFCVPTFMLSELKEVNVYDVMSLFNVEFDFALKRLEMYHNKIIERSNIDGTLSKTW